MIAPATGYEPVDREGHEHWYEVTRAWRSSNPRVPEGYAIDPEFNCLTNAENLVALDPSLFYREGWTRLCPEDEWGSHAWAETPEGEVVDPYFEWRLPGLPIEYRQAEAAYEDPFEYP